MLIEFRVKNFRSFKDEQVFSMVAGKDKTHPDNVTEWNKLDLLKTTGIYGANASGKSNLIKAMSVFRYHILNSATDKPGTKLKVDPFLLVDNEPDEITSFEMTFIIENVRYQYGYSLTKDEIKEEWLFASPKNNVQEWFYRKKDNDIKFGSYFKGEKKKLQSRTRPETLFLSVGAQWNNSQLKQIYDWFHNKLRIIEDRSSIEFVTSGLFNLFYLEDKKKYEKLNNFVLEVLKKADVGINGILISKKESQFDGPSPVTEDDTKYNDDEDNIDIQMIHETINGKQIPFTFNNESKGTLRLYEYLGPILATISNGFILIIDEIENSLHSLLTQALINIVQSKKNKSGAQLIYTTHDTVLLNPDYIRRDQIWFTEKKIDGSTKLFSLIEYKPRKNEAFQKGYLSGRYGAIPIIESFDLWEKEKVEKI